MLDLLITYCYIIISHFSGVSLNIQKTYYGETNVGRIRKNNEDAFIAQTIWNDTHLLCAAIDGIGVIMEVMWQPNLFVIQQLVTLNIFLYGTFLNVSSKLSYMPIML